MVVDDVVVPSQGRKSIQSSSFGQSRSSNLCPIHGVSVIIAWIGPSLVLGGSHRLLSRIVVGMSVGGHKILVSLYRLILSWSWWVGLTGSGKLRRCNARQVGYLEV